MDLTVSSFFHFYMFEPTRAERPAERLLAMISTIALGILSLGIAHLICYYTLFDRTFIKVEQPDEKQSAVDDLYRRIIDLDVEESPSASSWEQSSDDAGLDDPFDDQVLQDAFDRAEEPHSAVSESVHVRFQTPEASDKGSAKIRDENAVGEFPSRRGSMILPADDKGKQEEKELEIAQAVRRWGARSGQRESRLVRYISERRLKREKSKKRLTRTKSEKMDKKIGKKREMKRSFSLKDVFHAIRHPHEH